MSTSYSGRLVFYEVTTVVSISSKVKFSKLTGYSRLNFSANWEVFTVECFYNGHCGDKGKWPLWGGQGITVL